MGDVHQIIHPAFLRHGRVRGRAGTWSAVWSRTPARIPDLAEGGMVRVGSVPRESRATGAAAREDRRFDQLHEHGGALWVLVGSFEPAIPPANVIAWLTGRDTGLGPDADATVAAAFEGTPLGNLVGMEPEASVDGLGRALREDGRDECMANASRFAEESLRTCGNGLFVRAAGPVGVLEMGDPPKDLYGIATWNRFRVRVAPRLSTQRAYCRMDRIESMAESANWIGMDFGDYVLRTRDGGWLKDVDPRLLETDADVALFVREIPWNLGTDLLTLRRSAGVDGDAVRAGEELVEALWPRAMTACVPAHDHERILKAAADVARAIGIGPGSRGARVRLDGVRAHIERYALPRLREAPAHDVDDAAALEGLGPV